MRICRKKYKARYDLVEKVIHGNYARKMKFDQWKKMVYAQLSIRPGE